MNMNAQLSAALRNAFERPTRGIVGLVDDLLALQLDGGLQLRWEAGSCRVRLIEDGSKELLDVPLRKSVFRALLARVAALCNERTPNSVSPYGGQEELTIGAPPVVFRVTFTNTAGEQSLELIHVRAPSAGKREGGADPRREAAARGY